MERLVRSLFLVFFLFLNGTVYGEVFYRSEESFPSLEGMQEKSSEIIGLCPDNKAVQVVVYADPTDPFVLIQEVFVEPDFENRVLLAFFDSSEASDVYVQGVNEIEHYGSVYEYAEAYKNGVCGLRIDKVES